MAERKTFKLMHAEARRRAIEAIRTAPDGEIVVLSSPTRSGDQNALLHVWLSEIAKNVEWAGKKRDIETWKRLLVAAWLRTRGEPVEFLPAIDGHGVDVVFRRTSHLGKSEFSDLCEFVVAWAINEAGLPELG